MEDEEIAAFLAAAGLGSYQEIFTKNRIGVNELEVITADILPQLIGPIGDQLRFKKAVAARRSNVESVPTTSTDTAQCVVDVGTDDLTGFDLRRSNAFDFSPLLQDNNNILIYSPDQDIVSVPELQLATNPVETVPSPPRKKVRFGTVTEPVTSSKTVELTCKEGLEEFLKTCTAGGNALDFYEENKKISESVRRQLVIAIVDRLMVVYGANLNNSHHEATAKAIVELFPTEKVETYYLPPRSEGPKQTISKGKLPYRHRNLKVSMKERRVNIPQPSTCKVFPSAVTSDTLLPEQEFIESQVWLKSYAEPWTEVLDRWTNTAPNRVLQFTKSESLTTTDILKDWPLLKHPLGYTLVSVDFKFLFPEKDLELLNGWPRYRDTLISILKERSKYDKRSIVHHKLSSLPSEISEDGKDAVAMFFLPSLLQQGVIRQKGQKSWKPTIAEAQETFVMVTKDSVSKQIHLDQRRKKCEKMKRPIQPSVMIVGETLHTAKDFYVLFENVEYKMAGVLAAVDTCFKILSTLNLEYPPESYNTWMFLQRFFYKIIVESDKVPTCVTSLISEL